MKKSRMLLMILSISLLFSGCGCKDVLGMAQNVITNAEQKLSADGEGIDIHAIPEYSGSPFVVLNDNVPAFQEEDLTEVSYEAYGKLDILGRCSSVIACVGQDIMPTEERGSIGMVKPSGWHTVKYDCVDGKYLYNRCHLIGYQLTGENANEQNLITGTRYLNIEGMLPFENDIAEYVEKTGNHVLYRVTPIFEGTDLLAKGVQLEAMSVEDMGQGIMFHVYCYNVQPGIEIDYADGSSRLMEQDKMDAVNKEESVKTYVCNINTKKFHVPECKSVTDMKEKNKKMYTGSRESLIENGFSPCGSCKP